MSTSEHELKELMTAGLDGDAAAHRALLQRLSRQLRGYYRRRLSSVGRGPSEAEDLLQEALLAIHTRRNTYDRAELLMPWVYAIARYTSAIVASLTGVDDCWDGADALPAVPVSLSTGDAGAASRHSAVLFPSSAQMRGSLYSSRT